MKKAGISNLKLVLAVTLLLCASIGFRIAALNVENSFLNQIFTFSRDYLLIALFIFWGVSIKRRIIMAQVRRQLLGVAFLMVSWLIVREFKFRFITNINIGRYLWYLYYVPLLLIPILALLISMSLGKGENYKLPKWIYLFYIPTLIFIVFVLTNDFHEFVFRFTDSALKDEFHIVYGWLYYALTGWIYFCSLCAFFVMVTKLRVPKSKRFLWMPLVPFAAAIIYGILYISGSPLVHGYLGDMTVIFSLVFAGFFESCIRCSLIQSNSGYEALFYASRGIGAIIVDKSYNEVYSASDSENIPKEKMLEAEKEPVILENKKRLGNIEVSGGHCVWTEDISKLLETKEALALMGEELAERNAFLQLEYEKESEHKRVEEQNKLYDLLQSKTQSQLDEIERLISLYKRTQTEAQKEKIIAKIIVLGSFIKRRKNFILSAYENEFIPAGMLSSAFAESFRALKLLGIEGGFLVDLGEGPQRAETLINAYDFFEFIMEKSLETVHFLNVTVSTVKGENRISILTDTSEKIAGIGSAFTQMKAVFESDSSQFILPLKGGESL